jgi:hypothetical protein
VGETAFHENSLVNRTYTQPLFTGSLNTSTYIQSCVGTWVLKFFHHQASDTNGVEWNRMGILGSLFLLLFEAPYTNL